MTVFFIIVVTVILIGIIYQMSKKSKVEKSIDVVDTLLPETDIHAEITKTVEAIKAQEPVKKEQVEETVTKTKKLPTPKKKAAVKKTDKK